MRLFLLLVIAVLASRPALGGERAAALSLSADAQQQRWQAQADRTSITRDDWGIAHVRGHSDADAVFGMIYAQAEDDFPRIETNYLNALGRLAEAEGESAVFTDLRMKLFIDPEDLRARWARAPSWLRILTVAWADGLNAYLHSHPAVKPRVLTHFEPWMALAFSEGSIGGDIERVDEGPLRAFYGSVADAPPAPQASAYPPEPSGSNGIAIAPSRSASGHALLLINPHTSFFFRSELQVHSDEGLNVYGAATWGQFFIYQGFNEHMGWMHTSSGVDNVDFFRETVVRRQGRLYYRHGTQWRPVQTRVVHVAFRKADGAIAERAFTVFGTHHGPVIRQEGRKAGEGGTAGTEAWVSIALMQKPVEALSQSFLLTKAQNYRAYMKIMQLRANSSNNTVLADSAGDIAYLHPQFVPRRDDRFDYTHPVDGAEPHADWQGLHALDELPRVLNPPNGWIANTNNWPYSAAGAFSPKRADFPRYMDTAGENPRGLHAALLLRDRKDFTPDSLNAAAYDPYLPAFAQFVPAIVGAFDGLPEDHPYRPLLAEPIRILREWNFRSSSESVATTLAVLWGDELWSIAKNESYDEVASSYDAIAERLGSDRKLAALEAVRERLEKDFGDWRVPWGRMNRFERVTGGVDEHFTDEAPSIPIDFASGRWGALASFGAHRAPGTRRYYGNSGNSFVAIVEFGERVSARAISIGGASGDPGSPHFNDQTERYARGSLRPVYFYPEDLQGHIERQYAPQ
jgi:acyl-homoserine-lactone acylase